MCVFMIFQAYVTYVCFDGYVMLHPISYCGWKKSCKPINNGINHLSTGEYWCRISSIHSMILSQALKHLELHTFRKTWQLRCIPQFFTPTVSWLPCDGRLTSALIKLGIQFENACDIWKNNVWMTQNTIYLKLCNYDVSKFGMLVWFRYLSISQPPFFGCDFSQNLHRAARSYVWNCARHSAGTSSQLPTKCYLVTLNLVTYIHIDIYIYYI